MKIALFGGAFDPPHLGHQAVAKSLIKEDVVDEVWFVPVFKHPWADRYNKRKLAKYEDRVKMLSTMVDGEKTKVAHFRDVSFTYDTLIYFQEKYPEHEFVWIMGSEYLGRFDDFLKGHPKLSDFHFYVYPRSGYPLDPKLKRDFMTFLSGMPEVEVSSTLIKERLSKGMKIDDLVTPEVLQLIQP
jgi:nicotinate-nucleotide adenylyltransferase